MLTTTEYTDWLERAFLPIMGGEALSDEAEDDTGDDAGDNAEAEAKGDEGQADAGNDKAGNGDSEDDDNAHTISALRLEVEKSQRELAAAQKAIQKSKQEARAEREKRAKGEGNWEAVAKERETELADATERATKAEQLATTATEELDTFRREVRVTRLAQRLGFRDPGDAFVLLTKDETGDDKTCERALRQLAEKKDYLVDQRRATGRNMDGSGNGRGLTIEEIKKMSPEETNARWEEVSATMARTGGG